MVRYGRGSGNSYDNWYNKNLKKNDRNKKEFATADAVAKRSRRPPTRRILQVKSKHRLARDGSGHQRVHRSCSGLRSAPSSRRRSGVEGPEAEGEGEPTEETAREAAWRHFWSTQEQRDAQAAVVQAKARAFVRALANSGMPAEALESVYIHYLTKEIEKQVKELGPLWAWSGEDLDHKNYVWKQTGRAVAQRGQAGHQNGGQPRDGSAQKCKAPGHEGQTCMAVIDGEKFGGTQREGRRVKPRRGATEHLGM